MSTNSDGVYWKLLIPGTYLVKAVVFSRDGKELIKNDWSKASPSMESSVRKVKVKNRSKSSTRSTQLEEAQIFNFFVNPIQ